MYFNGRDYYYFNGVKSYFRKMLKDNEITKDEILYVLNKKKFPRKSIISNSTLGQKVIGIYDKSVLHSYFNSKEKCDAIKELINDFDYEDIENIKKDITNKRNSGNYSDNERSMIDYIDNTNDDYSDNEPDEEDMEYVSNELLRDDEVIYEMVCDDDTIYKLIYESDDLSDVETEWKPKKGLFLSKSPRYIANYLLDHSDNRGQAIKRLTFYMNRAGKNLKNKTVLNQAKKLLQEKD